MEEYGCSKSFKLQYYRPQVLFFGNGFFYNDVNWDENIEKGAHNDQYLSLSEEEKKNIPYLIRANLALQSALQSANDDLTYEDIFGKVNNDSNKDLVKKLMSIHFDAILTTNYTHQLEMLYRNSIKTLSTARRREKVDDRYLLHTFNRVGSTDIWHIHGDMDSLKSIVLKHDDYGRLFSNISQYLEQNEEDYDKYYPDFTFDTWIDYFSLADVYILGFGCDFSEFEFWWLLNNRSKHNAGKIICYIPSSNRNKSIAAALKLAGVECRDLGYSFPNENKTYNDFYNEALDDIQNERNRKIKGYIMNTPDVPKGSLFFGKYKYTPIEWQIIAYKDNKALLFSKYILDNKVFNNESECNNWSDSSLRDWLNNDFYNKSFTDEEKKSIIRSEVSPDSNPYYYYTNQGKTTHDHIFLLSYKELDSYLMDNDIRKYQFPTSSSHPSFIDNSIDKHTMIGKYWLRTMGVSYICATYVQDSGSIEPYGAPTYESAHGVRPAMWVDLDTNITSSIRYNY